MTRVAADYLAHFQNITWNLQGIEFVQAILANLEMHRVLKPETMWHVLPKIQECIIVGAGPSLKDNVHELAGCGIPLIVTDRALPTVLEHVAADEVYCVTNIESTAKNLWSLEKWWKDVDTSRFTLVAPTFLDPLVYTKPIWKGPVRYINVIFAHGDLNRLSERIQFLTGAQGMTTGSNVGVMSYILAYNLGCKRIALVGMDHVELEPPPVSEMYVKVKDVRGRDAYLWWNFYMGQWEILHLAKMLKEQHKIETMNCTEGGILYNDPIKAVPLAEYLRTRTPIHEEDVSVSTIVMDGDTAYMEKEVQ